MSTKTMRETTGTWLPGELRKSAQTVIAVTVRAGTRAYERNRDLPGLIRMMPGAVDADSIAETELIVARLERALRGERNRARSGHWTYDLNRHIALRQAHLAERERLAELRTKRR